MDIGAVNVNHRHDVPYMAGYSIDGKTIYIDWMLPDSYMGMDILPTLILHEMVEKSLIDTQDMDYSEAHHIATSAEEGEVRRQYGESGLEHYRAFFRHWYAVIGQRRRYDNIPGDLDLTPYRDDRVRLERMGPK